MKFRNLLCASLLMVSNLVSAQLPTASEIAAKMYPGWNLGNTMEANNNGTVFTNNVGLSGETSWQSTKTSKEVIDYVKSLGFKSVRIPCNWVCGHISNAADNTIDAEWMARVKEIVDYCVDAGLYVVLNDHYDGGWVETSFGSLDEATVSANCLVMNQIWTQIANTFKDYDEHLLFAGLNEPNVDNQSKTDVLVRYEQAFIDAVRATGGNNASRTLIVQGPSTDIEKTEKYFNTLQETMKENLNYLILDNTQIGNDFVNKTLQYIIGHKMTMICIKPFSDLDKHIKYNIHIDEKDKGRIKYQKNNWEINYPLYQIHKVLYEKINDKNFDNNMIEKIIDDTIKYFNN